MSPEELIIYFPHSADDDLEELYDERLFEYKQFFATRAVIPKVFKARLEKLNKMEQAYLQLSDQEEVATVSCLQVNFSENALDAFNLFEREKGIRKIRLLKATSGAEIKTAVECLIDLYHSFYLNWEPLQDEMEVLVGKEPDSMDVLDALRKESEKGICTFQELKDTQNELLRKEMKRVSLWLEMN